MDIIVFIHSWLRWAVLGLGFYNIYLAYTGKQSGEPAKKGLVAAFVGVVHLQIVIGLCLYFFGPNAEAFRNPMEGSIMKNATSRFFMVEHLATMIIAAVSIQIGSSKSKRMDDVIKAHATRLRFFGIGMALITLSVIQVVFQHGRPLFRF